MFNVLRMQTGNSKTPHVCETFLNQPTPVPLGGGGGVVVAEAVTVGWRGWQGLVVAKESVGRWGREGWNRLSLRRGQEGPLQAHACLHWKG